MRNISENLEVIWHPIRSPLKTHHLLKSKKIEFFKISHISQSTRNLMLISKINFRCHLVIRLQQTAFESRSLGVQPLLPWWALCTLCRGSRLWEAFWYASCWFSWCFFWFAGKLCRNQRSRFIRYRDNNQYYHFPNFILLNSKFLVENVFLSLIWGNEYIVSYLFKLNIHSSESTLFNGNERNIAQFQKNKLIESLEVW